MKQSLSPGIIVGAVVGLLAIVGVIFFFSTRSPAGSEEGKTSSGSGIPPQIQKQIQQQMQGGGGAPTAPRTSGTVPGPPGGMPGGAPGSLMAPPGASGMGGR